MLNKFKLILIIIIFVGTLIGCDKLTDATIDGSSTGYNGPTYSINGDIQEKFYSSSPTASAFVSLLDKNTNEVKYLCSTATWRTTKTIGFYTRFASYNLTGVIPGEYKIVCVIDPTADVYNGLYTAGPLLIDITSDTIKDLIIQ